MSMAAKAHGLDGALVEPDWPPLTLEELADLFALYPDLSDPIQLLTVSPRPFSAASVVATPHQHVFVKRHARAIRDAQGLHEEHRFMAHLRAHGAEIAQVHATPSGETAIERGQWTYEVHSIPRGVDLYGEAISWTPFRSPAHARSAGETMARLHLAAHAYDAPARKERQLVAGFSIFAAQDPQHAWDRYVASRPVLDSYLQEHPCRDRALELLAPFHAELQDVLPQLPPLWTHNDLHPSNLFWTDRTRVAQATAAIDFGLCDRTNAVHDLAHALERSMVGWLALMQRPDHPERVPVHRDSLFALLEGYEAVRPLSAAEAAALPAMLALCHAEFALSEGDYFLSILQSQEKARVACEDYLIDHARWFRGSGAGLLVALRGWAAERTPSKGAIRR